MNSLEKERLKVLLLGCSGFSQNGQTPSFHRTPNHYTLKATCWTSSSQLIVCNLLLTNILYKGKKKSYIFFLYKGGDYM